MVQKISDFFASRLGIISVGITIGVCAFLLQRMGNPPNMGVCVACFQRDIAGAIGLHQAAVAQYIRPEIIGLVLGAMIAALLFKEFKATGGSAPIVRFVLGIFAMIGALVFLGCPWRALLRLAGGDLNAFIGILGLTTGIFFGVLFIKYGFTLGRSTKTFVIAGFTLPVIMAGLFVLLLIKPVFIAFSTKGPGSMHAPVIISLLVAIVVGFLAQRSRFCTVGAIRNVLLMKDIHLLSGVVALFAAIFLLNMLFGGIKFGFLAQPIAHSSHIWNFLGMVLAGLCFTLAGGCPGRQLFMAGEGNGDSAIFIIGMITGAAVGHNFIIAAKPDSMVDGVLKTGGIGIEGIIAVIVGLCVCVVIGLTMREKIKEGI